MIDPAKSARMTAARQRSLARERMDLEALERNIEEDIPRCKTYQMQRKMYLAERRIRAELAKLVVHLTPAQAGFADGYYPDEKFLQAKKTWGSLENMAGGGFLYNRRSDDRP